MPCNHIIHIVVFTQVQLQQIDFHFTVLHKHAMLYYLKVGPTKKKKKQSRKLDILNKSDKTYKPV